MPDAGHSSAYFTAIGSNRSTFGAGHDHEVDPRCGAGRAAACRYVRECRPVERTSKPAVPLPLSGLRGHRRDLIHQRGAVLPDPQLHSGFRHRKLQLLVLHPQPPLLWWGRRPGSAAGHLFASLVPASRNVCIHFATDIALTPRRRAVSAALISPPAPTTPLASCPRPGSSTAVTSPQIGSYLAQCARSVSRATLPGILTR
jgi:hypothetical protein